MKIAIHHRDGSFSELWIAYCEENNILFKIVDCYANDIIEQVKDCKALMWHHHHGNYKDLLFAKQVLFSFEQSKKIVFPDCNTSWHFDDKVGQKYLLESIKAPFINTTVFYDKEKSLKWVENTLYPKVFKLRNGAGSSKVKLIKNKNQANKLVKRAFATGFSQFNRFDNLIERFNKFRDNKDSFWGVLKGLGRLIIPVKNIHLFNKEKGYVYFQDFLKENEFDIRIIVIDEKAFGIKRMVRKNDFRASGSGTIIYNKDEIDVRCIEIAFETSRKLKSQCLAYDFIFDELNNPLIVEISYGFSSDGYKQCPGYWDDTMKWIEGEFNPYGWMVEGVLTLLRKAK